MQLRNCFDFLQVWKKKKTTLVKALVIITVSNDSHALFSKAALGFFPVVQASAVSVLLLKWPL